MERKKDWIIEFSRYCHNIYEIQPLRKFNTSKGPALLKRWWIGTASQTRWRLTNKPLTSLTSNKTLRIFELPVLSGSWHYRCQISRFCAQSEARTQMASWTSPLKVCSQGLCRPSCKLSVSPFFCSHRFRPFYVPLAPTICPWVSEDSVMVKVT